MKKIKINLNGFCDIVKNIEMSKYPKYQSFIDNIEDPTLRAILKYKNYQIFKIISKVEIFFISENSKKEI